jgi:hypothetical protein
MMHVMQHLQLTGNSSFVQLTSNSSSSTNSSSLLRVPGQPSSMLGLTCGLPDSASFMYLVQQQQLVGDSSTLHLRGNTSSSAVLQEQQVVVQVEASAAQQAVPAPVAQGTPRGTLMTVKDKAAAMFVAWIVGAHMHVSCL